MRSLRFTDGRTVPNAVRSSGDATCSAEAARIAEQLNAFRRRCIIHGYAYEGIHYLVDPWTGTLFRLGTETHRLVKAIEDRLPLEALTRLVRSLGENVAISLLTDLARLEREGLFRRPHYPAGGAVDDTVKAYLRHHPRKMMLCVSQTCNLRCVYCYAIQGNYEDEGRLMSLETAQQAIRFLASRARARRSLTVTLFGGEPLVNFPVISRLVPWARSWLRTIGKRVHFCVTTNGTLLTDPVVEFLVTHRFSVLVSLDGPREVQDAGRPFASGKGSFDAAASGIRRLLQRHPHPEVVKVRATMTHQSHDTERLARFFEDFGFRRIGLGAAVGHAFGKGPYDLTDEDRWELERSAQRFARKELDTALKGGRQVAFDPITRGLLSLHQDLDRVGPQIKVPCGVGRNDQAVDVDGFVYPCHRYVGMRGHAIGDIWEGLDEQSVASYYQRLLRAHDSCLSCWVSRWCAGHCPQYLSEPGGRIHQPDEAACSLVRKAIERQLALYDRYSALGVDWDRLARESRP